RLERAPRAARETGEPGGGWIEVVSARRRLACRRAQLHLRDQAAEVLISLAIFDEQRQARAADERDLGAYQRLDPGVDRSPVQPWRTVHAIAIDERDRAPVSLHRLGRERLRTLGGCHVR